VLVATPGRLIDHLENSGLAQKLQRIRTLVLDEADQLLEMGFRPAIERVLSFLPRDRQTLLFSATMPQAVQQVAGLALKQQHSFIDTIGEEDSATNVQVEQSYALIPMEQQFAAIYNVLRRHAEETPDHKVIVFFTTARLTQYMAALIDAAGLPVLEIHSRKSQSAREKASAQFRTARSAIMFSSDVSARGVDYPDVTLVLQVANCTWPAAALEGGMTCARISSGAADPAQQQQQEHGCLVSPLLDRAGWRAIPLEQYIHQPAFFPQQALPHTQLLLLNNFTPADRRALLPRAVHPPPGPHRARRPHRPRRAAAHARGAALPAPAARPAAGG
jgi:hypothetical protein